MDGASFERVYDNFRDFHAFFAASFGRRQWREHSRNYLQGLLVQAGERRNAENLSESVGIPAREFIRDGRQDSGEIYLLHFKASLRVVMPYAQRDLCRCGRLCVCSGLPCVASVGLRVSVAQPGPLENCPVYQADDGGIDVAHHYAVHEG